MFLETNKISKSFGNIEALVDVNFALKKGEILGLAGPNGAGKSTLFNVISGTYPPSSGRVLFDGKDITGIKADKICHQGLARTFQIPTTFRTLSVYDNIRVGATFGKPGSVRLKERIEDSIELLGLKFVRDTLAVNLDLFTTKLVMMAACLATECRLLLLDEPLAGLSAMEINNFLHVAQKINKEQGVTILIIEHILDSLFDVSSRILILHNGKIIFTGSPNDVASDPRVIEVYLGEEGGQSG